MNKAVDYAIKWWKRRHEQVYFPAMEQHKDWLIYPEMPGWFLEHLKPKQTDKALEIGCGYGQWMIPLSRLVAGVDGFDIHGTLVNKAAEKFQEHKAQNCRMVLGDGQTIPFNEFYDIVYSISVFQHMPRAIVHGYLREADRVMKSGSKFLFYFRADNHDGPYSDDIYDEHTGDWSVGWSVSQCEEAAGPFAWDAKAVDMGDVILLVGTKR